jgi:hypothetical protein
MGELSSYTGGALRGATTTRIDAFAQEGMMLLNFNAPKTQCTPSRSARGPTDRLVRLVLKKREALPGTASAKGGSYELQT